MPNERATKPTTLFGSRRKALRTQRSWCDPGTDQLTTLSNAFLIHEEQLGLLQHQFSLVYQIRSVSWQGGLVEDLRPGEHRPWGSCSVAVATALLYEVTKGDPPADIDKENYKRFLKVVDGLINITTAKTKLANEIAHCSARPNKLKSHISLDFRVAIYSDLMPYTSMIAAIFDTYDCERLGKKAPGGLARKARGRS